MQLVRLRGLAAASAALTMAVALTAGCGRDTGRPDRSAASAPSASSPTASPSPALRRADPLPGRVVDLGVVQPDESGQRAALFMAPDPQGTRVQIALRFVAALRRGDDWAAAHELGLVGRAALANHDDTVLHLVMADVRARAGVEGSRPCVGARIVNAQAVAVLCGPLVVVVHVRASAVGSGVLLSAEHPRHDVVRGPHTHAYTRFVLL